MTVRPCFKSGRRTLYGARRKGCSDAKGATGHGGANLVASSRKAMRKVKYAGAQNRAVQYLVSLLHRREECQAMPTLHQVASRGMQRWMCCTLCLLKARGEGSAQQNRQGA